jgi:hypothetical protein
MSFVCVVNETRHSLLGNGIRIADSLTARLRGFLFRRRPVFGEGLFMAPCKGVHMYGMRFPLDVLMLDRGGVVVAVHANLPPGQRTPVYGTATYALELPVGAINASGTTVGDRLTWKPANPLRPPISALEAAPLRRRFVRSSAT